MTPFDPAAATLAVRALRTATDRAEMFLARTAEYADNRGVWDDTTETLLIGGVTTSEAVAARLALIVAGHHDADVHTVTTCPAHPDRLADGCAACDADDDDRAAGEARRYAHLR